MRARPLRLPFAIGLPFLGLALLGLTLLGPGTACGPALPSGSTSAGASVSGARPPIPRGAEECRLLRAARIPAAHRATFAALLMRDLTLEQRRPADLELFADRPSWQGLSFWILLEAPPPSLAELRGRAPIPIDWARTSTCPTCAAFGVERGEGRALLTQRGWVEGPEEGVEGLCEAHLHAGEGAGGGSGEAGSGEVYFMAWMGTGFTEGEVQTLSLSLRERGLHAEATSSRSVEHLSHFPPPELRRVAHLGPPQRIDAHTAAWDLSYEALAEAGHSEDPEEEALPPEPDLGAVDRSSLEAIAAADEALDARSEQPGAVLSVLERRAALLAGPTPEEPRELADGLAESRYRVLLALGRYEEASRVAGERARLRAAELDALIAAGEIDERREPTDYNDWISHHLTAAAYAGEPLAPLLVRYRLMAAGERAERLARDAADLIRGSDARFFEIWDSWAFADADEGPIAPWVAAEGAFVAEHLPALLPAALGLEGRALVASARCDPPFSEGVLWAPHTSREGERTLLRNVGQGFPVRLPAGATCELRLLGLGTEGESDRWRVGLRGRTEGTQLVLTEASVDEAHRPGLARLEEVAALARALLSEEGYRIPEVPPEHAALREELFEFCAGGRPTPDRCVLRELDEFFLRRFLRLEALARGEEVDEDEEDEP